MPSHILQAYAVGDAMGMPTEFMSRDAIIARFGPLLEGLQQPAMGMMHPNLAFGQVTDDTEQVLYLLRHYQKSGRVNMHETAQVLESWVRETGADVKGYIGPSSKRALAAIRQGIAPEKAGEGGTTCGGIMRVPAAVLYRHRHSLEGLREDVYQCLAPTHNSVTALEAAGAYAAALHSAMQGASLEQILDAACRFGEEMKQLSPHDSCAPSCRARIRFAQQAAQQHDQHQLLDVAHHLIGTGLASADVCFAVFAIFCHAGKDAWLAIRMGASVGGDTDTIAALAGALSAAYAGRHNIPAHVLTAVLEANRELLVTYRF